jgi:hypothetical protein
LPRGQQTRRGSNSARKLTEHFIEGTVFFDDEDNVLYDGVGICRFGLFLGPSKDRQND